MDTENNSTTLELLILGKDSLDNNKSIDQQIVDHMSELIDNLDSIDYDALIISIFDILNDPVTQPLLIALEDEIEKQFKREPEFPIMARIKTCIVYFFTGNGNLTKFHNTLIAHERDWGKNLGYDRLGEGYWLPSYKTIHQFLRKNMGVAIYNNFDKFVKIVIDIAENYGLHPGFRSIMDSTPHESTPNDKDAEYNGHYKINGYKEHRIIGGDTDIPLAFKVTKANEYDGHHSQELLQKAMDGNAKIAAIWMDQHYVTFENLPFYELKKQVKTHYRISKDWKLDKSVNEIRINDMYQRLFKHDDFLIADDPRCTMEFKLEFIWDHSPTDSHRKAVGQYLRNQAHLRYEETPKQYLSEKGFRSNIEGGFGVEKLHSILKSITFRGMKSWKALISIENFIDLLIAVFRMDLGKKRKLTSRKGIVV